MSRKFVERRDGIKRLTTTARVLVSEDAVRFVQRELQVSELAAIKMIVNLGDRLDEFDSFYVYDGDLNVLPEGNDPPDGRVAYDGPQAFRYVGWGKA